ncbi:hypothetical protein BGZ96_002347 [Linnemannia gamsii]|uniref:Uncharacterized protein n=1 Tax=Linnemannia gamsii TaxID=64522 RepID=A0ABQ7KB14_9FUNG|nr:hypothetical protein BGZ96_002347 [Linnemannia gamsii]
MAPERSRHYGRRTTKPEEDVQSFWIPLIEASEKRFSTQLKSFDTVRSVRVRHIRGYYKKYDRIERTVPDGFEELHHLPNPPVRGETRERPRWLRIRAYPQEVLRVIYREGEQNQPIGEPMEGYGESDNEGDDASMDEDDNPPEGGNEGDPPEGDDDENMTDGDDPNDSDDMDPVITNFSTQNRMSASLSIPSLTPFSIGSTEYRPFTARHFVTIPMSTLDTDGKPFSMDHTSWKVFRICVGDRSKPTTEGWSPHLIHERSYGVVGRDKAARFIQLFGPVLLYKAEKFLANFGNTYPGTDPAPMSAFNTAISHLRQELSLESDNQVEPYLEQTVKDLKDSIALYHYSGTSTSPKRYRFTKSDRTLFSLYIAKDSPSPDDMDVDDDNESGSCLTADSLGHERCVCRHHHRRLHPGYIHDHVKTQSNGVASYDVETGKITADLKSVAALTAFCNIDPDNVGFVSEFSVKVDWGARVEDINQLHEFAARLGITTMTISDGDGSEAPDITGRSITDETNHVRQLLLGTIARLKRVSFIWSSSLDVSALVKEISAVREDHLYLVVKDNLLEVSSVIHDGILAASRIKSALGDLPSVSGESFLTGKAQNLEIADSNWSTETKDEIQQQIQASPALTTLIMDCSTTSHAFKSMFKAIDGIVRPLNTGPHLRLRFKNLILKNNSDNDVAALFDLSKPSQKLSITPRAVDVTARSATVPSFLRGMGVSIRVLHLIGLTPGCLNVLDDIFYSEIQPDRLVSLTLLLDHIRTNHIDSLKKLLVSSKTTFKQLALIDQPQDPTSRTAVLSALKTLQGFQVLLTKTKTSDTQWITDATNAIEATSSSTAIIVESAQELAQIVPSFTNAGLVALKAIFDRPPYIYQIPWLSQDSSGSGSSSFSNFDRPESYILLNTTKRARDNHRSVLMSLIVAELVISSASRPTVKRYLPRIRAYPDQILRVVYPLSNLDALQGIEQLSSESDDELDISDSDDYEDNRDYEDARDMHFDDDDENDGEMAGAVFGDDSAENVLPELSDSAIASMDASIERRSHHLVERRTIAYLSGAIVDFTSNM